MSSSADMLEASHVDGWSDAVQRGARRFFALYFTLYAFPFPLQFLGLGATAFSNVRVEIAAWLGRHVFGLEQVTIASSQGTSSDRAIDYIWLAVLAALAALGTLGWSLAKPRAETEQRFTELACVYVRYAVGVEILGYGMFKLLPVQFGTLDPILLTRSVGELPPMRLLWAFMAASRPYTIFGGAAEVLGACLLFARRTTLLGSLILIGVMTNVVLLNLCYDVPIKIHASHLLASTFFLAAPDAKSLRRALLASRPRPSMLRPRSSAQRWVVRLVKLGCVAGAATIYCIMVYRAYTSQQQATRHPLYGVWEVEAARADVLGWQRVAISNDNFHVIFPDARRRKLQFEEDAQNHTVRLVDPHTKAQAGRLRATLQAEGVRLRLDGEVDQQSIAMDLKRKNDFPLLTRGFHWVNDTSIKDY